ncbi:hypothetical protein [Bdellovibrio sp. NC01]|uniref:hypothetical protein n=1 Tax=Bdellovibrio sp. NC01 TaxID=2220073 RepID=UPI00115711C4|nr:hypothetical protein [Bdellovibrio sp. NC01]QDK38059.1 hypothetical protein DOE51_10900 [Bdellovibrio sp. NC01]
MKFLIFAVLVLNATISFASENCADSVEAQIAQQQHTQVEQSPRLDFSGNKVSIFTVRTNTHGGQAQLEAVVDKTTCQVVNTFTVWAE